ncbi:hypothetical protein K2224_37770 (plasmid) [Streptomyces sp. BHT-5-2]|uniref:hypothetical protein n=1 Tax=Streptomyces sp. BHT-5-2 TaxID=2866715 RepID=UPI001C8E6386|nr:hypothetical protein [Streptomyces sp. BHT-5-2]QZL08781.1 hypothetical protein K2224_37770 [Streptomyces sp. BHT-5-2]
MAHTPAPPTTAESRAEQPVVLVLDYPGHRPEAKLSELRLEDAGFDVRYLLTRPLPRDLSADAYASRALQAAENLPCEIHAVLAYCMSATLAQHVAALTSASHLLLFDAEISAPDVVAKEVREILRSFMAGAELPGWWSDDALARSPVEVMDRVHDHLFEVIRTALAEDSGMDDQAEDPAATQVARNLVGTYMDWLAHLVAAHRSVLPAFAGASAQIVSARHVLPDTWPGLSSPGCMRMASERQTLAADEETRRFVLRALGGSAR